MPDSAIALFATFIMVSIGYMMGWLTRDNAPAKGEIILVTEGPHKCKGMPKAHRWYIGTQWQCNTCKDIWEVTSMYDGRYTTKEWIRQ